MSDLEALALILTNPGVQLLVLAFFVLVTVLVHRVMRVLRSNKLTSNAARILREWRGKK